MALEHYQPSGKFKPTVLAWVPVAMLGAIACAWLYELLLHHIPFIYVNFLLVLGFGGLLGVAGSGIVKRGEVRNPWLAYGVGFAIAFAGLAASYAWGLLRWVDLVVEANPGMSRLAVMLEGAGQWVDARVEAGWRLKSSTLNGAAVWAIWSVEAISMLGVALFVVREQAHLPYCEHCQRWMSTQGGAITGQDASAALPLLESGDLSGLITLPAGDGSGDPPQLALLRAYCPSCTNHEWLSVSEVKYTRGSKNELQEHKKVLASNVLLPLEARQKFSERFGPAQSLPLP